jgi:hypothetical protein
MEREGTGFVLMDEKLLICLASSPFAGANVIGAEQEGARQGKNALEGE